VFSPAARGDPRRSTIKLLLIAGSLVLTLIALGADAQTACPLVARWLLAPVFELAPLDMKTEGRPACFDRIGKG
jgi:hypothetical protein